MVVAKQGKYLPKGEMNYLQSRDYPYPVWGGNGILGYGTRQSYTTPITLMTCRGSNCGLIRLTESGAWVSNNSFACIPRFGSTYFPYIYFIHDSFSDCISGSAPPQITYTALRGKRMRCAVERKICEVFSEAVEPLFSKLLSDNSETEALERTRDLLLPKLMSGEIRLKEAERIAEAAK